MNIQKLSLIVSELELIMKFMNYIKYDDCPVNCAYSKSQPTIFPEILHRSQQCFIFYVIRNFVVIQKLKLLYTLDLNTF